MRTVTAGDALGLLRAGCDALGIELSAGQEAQFAAYARLLAEGNRRVNLTRVTEPAEVEARHFLDSLTAAAALPASTLRAGRVLDVGSGAGFPGVPLRIAYPGMAVELLEATGKKAAFLRGLVYALEIGDVPVHPGRAEDLARWSTLRAGFDAVVARGVARMATLAELTLPFLRVGGALVAHKTAGAAQETAEAAAAIAALGGAPAETLPVSTPGLGEGRVLVMVRKIAATPEAYPRRAGMPAKRPLGRRL